jgi:hypothetical protein
MGVVVPPIAIRQIVRRVITIPMMMPYVVIAHAYIGRRSRLVEALIRVVTIVIIKGLAPVRIGIGASPTQQQRGEDKSQATLSSVTIYYMNSRHHSLPSASSPVWI